MKPNIFFIVVIMGLFSVSAIAQDQSALRKKQFNLDNTYCDRWL